MFDGMCSSRLRCISTKTFSDIDFYLKRCLRFAPQSRELLQNTIFFCLDNYVLKKPPDCAAKRNINKNLHRQMFLLKCILQLVGLKSRLLFLLKDKFSFFVVQ